MNFSMIMTKTHYSNSSRHSIRNVAGAIISTSLLIGAPSFAVELEGFETPALPISGSNALLKYDPQGSGWTFSGKTGRGIQRDGSDFAGPKSPEGTQTAFLTGDSASISRGVYLAAGVYTVSFAAARAPYDGQYANPIKVTINNESGGHHRTRAGDWKIRHLHDAEVSTDLRQHIHRQAHVLTSRGSHHPDRSSED